MATDDEGSRTRLPGEVSFAQVWFVIALALWTTRPDLTVSNVFEVPHGFGWVFEVTPRTDREVETGAQGPEAFPDFIHVDPYGAVSGAWGGEVVESAANVAARARIPRAPRVTSGELSEGEAIDRVRARLLSVSALVGITRITDVDGEGWIFDLQSVLCIVTGSPFYMLWGCPPVYVGRDGGMSSTS